MQNIFLRQIRQYSRKVRQTKNKPGFPKRLDLQVNAKNKEDKKMYLWLYDHMRLRDKIKTLYHHFHKIL